MHFPLPSPPRHFWPLCRVSWLDPATRLADPFAIDPSPVAYCETVTELDELLDVFALACLRGHVTAERLAALVMEAELRRLGLEGR